MQILDWAGGLYLDFLGLSGEIWFFPSCVLSWEGDVHVFPPQNKIGAWNYCYTLMP